MVLVIVWSLDLQSLFEEGPPPDRQLAVDEVCPHEALFVAPVVAIALLPGAGDLYGGHFIFGTHFLVVDSKNEGMFRFRQLLQKFEIFEVKSLDVHHREEHGTSAW